MKRKIELAVPIVTGMMKNLKFAWKRYMRFSVVENDDIIDILFHSFCGSIFTKFGWTYQEAGKKKTPRIHAFFIQSSGTGKSECFNALIEAIKLVSINGKFMKAEKVGTAHEAAITGTAGISKETGVSWSKDGMLKDTDLFCFDEGSALLEEATPAMRNVMNQLQLAMDEPGVVRKFMRDASIKYSTNSTIISGSYFYDNFKKTVLERGFLQRMIIVYREIYSEEYERISVGINELKLSGNYEKRLNYINELSKYMERFSNCRLMNFNREGVLKFNRDWRDFRHDAISNFFTDDKQEILNTYYNRSMNIVNKFSLVSAIISGHKEIMYDDLLYGLFYAKKHIISVNNILSKVYKDRKESRTSREVFLFNYINVKSQVTQKELVNFLLNEARIKGYWDLARNRTLDFIKKCEFIKRTPIEGKRRGFLITILPEFRSFSKRL